MTRAPLLACVAVLSFFAGVTGIRLAYTLTYALALLLLVSFLWSRVLGRAITVQRSSPGGSFVAGETFEEQFVICNDSAIPAAYCEAVDRSDIRGYRASRACALRAHNSLQWTARGSFLRRGEHSFGPLQVRVGDPFGLFHRDVVAVPRKTVLVYPRAYELDLSQGLGGASGGGHARLGPTADVPPDVASVREYEAGDSLNRIHWRSSAHHGKLMSRSYDTRHSADLMVILDMEYGTHFGTEPHSSVEYAVTLAASLCQTTLRAGDAVGLVCNDRQAHSAPAARGEVQRQRIFNILALAKDDASSPLVDTITRQAQSWRGRGNIAVITASRDPSWVEALLDSGARGQRHLAIYVDPVSFGAGGQSLRPMAAWRVALDWWLVRRGDDLSRRSPGRAQGA